MLLIYSKSLTPRLRYTFELVFRDLLGTEFVLTSDRQEFLHAAGPKMSYGDNPLGDEFFIYAVNLLFEKGIKDQDINVFEWENTKAFFATHPRYPVPFDLFAAVFFLVSRYEEYLPHLRDNHDRYDTRESVAYQKNFLEKPLVNIWAKKFREILAGRFPDLKFQNRKYRYISTVDIDSAYAFLEKGFMRTAGSFARSLLHFDFKDLRERAGVLLGLRHDPYDTFSEFLKLQEKYKYRNIFFALLAEYGENDKNVPPDSKKLRSLIKYLADYAEVGIHPSYESNRNPARLKSEVAVLNRILKREVTRSRQHFLILKLPVTYRRLIDLDITDDYTMGYAMLPGFRAGICTPFYFYDLDMDVATQLRIHPFAVMDATLNYYMKIKPEQAMDVIRPLIKEVKDVQGDFVSLWHNSTLSDKAEWKGWKNIYEQMVIEAVS